MNSVWFGVLGSDGKMKLSQMAPVPGVVFKPSPECQMPAFGPAAPGGVKAPTGIAPQGSGPVPSGSLPGSPFACTQLVFDELWKPHTPVVTYSQTELRDKLPGLLTGWRNGIHPPSPLSKFQGTRAGVPPPDGQVVDPRMPRSSTPFGTTSSVEPRTQLSSRSSPSVLVMCPPASPTTNMVENVTSSSGK